MMAFEDLIVGSTVWWNGPAGDARREIFAGFYRIKGKHQQQVFLEKDNHQYVAYSFELSIWPS